MAAIVTGLGDIFNLGLLKLGMQPHYLGTVFAAASVLGAALGMVIHHLKRLSFHQYASLDLVVNATMFIAFGLLRSLTAAVVVFICNMALWRFQRIMYQHYMLEIYGTTRYKATLLSLISNFGIVHEVWLALAFSQLAHVIGILPSLSYGAVLALVAWPVLLVSISQFTANAAASARSKNQ